MKPSWRMDVNTHTQAVCIGAIWDKDRLYPFSNLKKHFSQVSILKITYSHIHTFFVFLIKKSLKWVYKDPTYTFFYDTQNLNFLKKEIPKS